ncbi:ribosome biogenesis protein TSR3 isoform X1 [Aphis craccivora]|uniref:Ribosome biogenesis protein TSR3 isoform X1 n=1 Tax=Aphis craccivora TaxID=307492 RepID=A0A6G0ZCS5_APHCR|nr:ribosome biogenesis protein TSR3 isoform X1 [Aphis craccivora]
MLSHFCSSAKSANTKIIQAFQVICLRMIGNASWYVTNIALHNNLKVTTIR